MSRITTMFSPRLMAVACAAALAGCSFFEGDGNSAEDGSEDGTDDGTVDGETGAPPEVGLRVYPKYMLQDVQANVTLEVGATQLLCPPDEDDGGYLCDIDDLNTDTALVRVELDGFETALVQPDIEQDIIQSIDVHLEPIGGPVGVWSSCVLVDVFTNCDEVCTDQGADCAPAACESNAGASTVASMESFDNQDCSGSPQSSQAGSCSDQLPTSGGSSDSLRCCCTM